jgi:hypothetical protein
VDNAALSTGPDGSEMLSNTIDGFVSGGILDLAGVSYDNNGRANLGPGNVRQIVENGQTYQLYFDPSQVFTGAQFELSPDGEVGTDVTFGPAPQASCFMPRTMISTPNGARPVEMLERGDLISTVDGRALPVAWIGRQTVSARSPIRFAFYRSE